MKRSKKILFYDIETSPLAAWIWRCGKQVVRHGQLMQGHSRYGIICITYCFNDGKKAKCINWGFKEQDTAKVVKEFDEIIAHEKPDIIIGKNSDRFDNKQVNAIRMFEQLKPNTDFFRYTDDLEKQMRRFFYMPSYTLDYFSAELGLGGKLKMELNDWVNIITRDPKKGKAALRKMCTYGKKDIEDTRALWEYAENYFMPKLNMATMLAHDKPRCYRCGSEQLVKNGTRVAGKTRYQSFWCAEGQHYAGRAPISKTGKIGTVGG